MLDNLKEHIENQRDDFELYPFDTEKGWKEISGNLSKEKQWPVWKLISVAACLILIAVSSVYQLKHSEPIDNELAELEQYYNGEINQKITLVKSQLKDDHVLKDLELMDQAFAELKADLKDNVDNQEVVAAMMENYQLKLRILEEILTELEKEKRESDL